MTVLQRLIRSLTMTYQISERGFQVLYGEDEPAGKRVSLAGVPNVKNLVLGVSGKTVF